MLARPSSSPQDPWRGHGPIRQGRLFYIVVCPPRTRKKVVSDMIRQKMSHGLVHSDLLLAKGPLPRLLRSGRLPHC